MGLGEIKKYLVIVEDRTFFYTELNGFDMTPQLFIYQYSTGHDIIKKYLIPTSKPTAFPVGRGDSRIAPTIFKSILNSKLSIITATHV
ncbi:hypothetical protein CYANOKiyG1_70310 [Okeania sp. KiyG1]|nr:hypothetical protein CYANOKiyG1_70310 [Okeania sp. KiyG1]